jgi:transcriptional regulator with XRE-family HTH domain
VSDGGLGTGRTPRTEVGTVLTAARRSAGLTQAEVARRLGIAQTSVSALERGVYLPDEELWRRYVELYGLGREEAAELGGWVRAARTLGGAAADAEPDAPWPLDPASCSRVGWVGRLRAHHRLTRSELAAHLGVPVKTVVTLEHDGSPLPPALQAPAVLRSLAALGGADELALRTAWQPDEIDGLEHLVGLEGGGLVAACADADTLLRWLVASGWTRAAIAAECGVARPAVSQWLAGRTTPEPGKLAGLAAALGAHQEDLAALR